ncbi:DUF6538 domain-containing protein [Roseovarius sp. SYSU LYC5161]|uniref:DUF6538 domain-containing protein n=1 Tax=Roseovarius halophilus (ex Wu et al. 2025) TaxID=3376060 RepID=UPI00399ACB41
MGVMTHVTRRGASYIWRRRIPKRALQSKSDGLSTKNNGVIVQVSLGTRDLSTAARRAPLVSAAFDDMIEGMTYTSLTRAHLRQYLESVVQAEVARIEEARLFEAPPASSLEWRARWMRDRAEAYALRLLSSRGPGAELLPEDMDHLRDAGFQPRDMAMVAEALYAFSTTYYRDKTHSAPEPADVVDHVPTAELDEMLYTREALKGAAVAREQLDRRKTELADPIGTVGLAADTHVRRAEANESASATASRYSPEIKEVVVPGHGSETARCAG